MTIRRVGRMKRAPRVRSRDSEERFRALEEYSCLYLYLYRYLMPTRCSVGSLLR